MVNWFDSKQAVGNAGLFFCSYKLATKGWNVLITSRNAQGPDMIIYSNDGKISHTIQVKSSGLPNRTTNVGQKPQNFLLSEFAILCSNLKSNSPVIHIAKTTDFILHPSKGGHYIKPKEITKFKNNFKVLGTP